MEIKKPSIKIPIPKQTSEKNDVDSNTIPDIESKKTEYVDANEKLATEKIKINFYDEDFIEKHIGQPTNDAEGVESDNVNTFDDDETKQQTPDVEKIRQDVKNAENNPDNQMGYDDYSNIAKLIIAGFGTGLELICTMLGGGTPAEYELPRNKQKILEHHLTLILVKHGAKFKVELILLMTAFSFYAIPVASAISRRKEKKRQQKISNGMKKTNAAKRESLYETLGQQHEPKKSYYQKQKDKQPTDLPGPDIEIPLTPTEVLGPTYTNIHNEDVAASTTKIKFAPRQKPGRKPKNRI